MVADHLSLHGWALELPGSRRGSNNLDWQVKSVMKENLGTPKATTKKWPRDFAYKKPVQTDLKKKFNDFSPVSSLSLFSPSKFFCKKLKNIYLSTTVSICFRKHDEMKSHYLYVISLNPSISWKLIISQNSRIRIKISQIICLKDNQKIF